MFSCESFEIFKNTFFCRSPPVAASAYKNKFFIRRFWGPNPFFVKYNLEGKKYLAVPSKSLSEKKIMQVIEVLKIKD